MIFILLVAPLFLALYEWVFGYDIPMPSLLSGVFGDKEDEAREENKYPVVETMVEGRRRYDEF